MDCQSMTCQEACIGSVRMSIYVLMGGLEIRYKIWRMRGKKSSWT